MSLGENIKKFRVLSHLTQNELAEKLFVSYQTISKWEKGINEPDIDSIKSMCKIFNCTLDQLINSAPVVDNNKDENEEPKIIKVLMGKCSECGQDIFNGDASHQMQRRTNAGLENVLVCENCYKKHEDLEQKRKEIENHSLSSASLEDSSTYGKLSFKDRLHSRRDSTVLVWSIISGCIALIATLVVCIVFYKTVGLGWTIGLPLIAGYALLADVYCIFSATWISDLFLEVASWSVRFPGIIFSFSLEGLGFLIFMKILFFVLGIFIGIAAFCLALALSSFFSIFCFPFVVGRNK